MRSRSGGHGSEAMGFDSVRSPAYSGKGIGSTTASSVTISRLGFGIECIQKYQHHPVTVGRPMGEEIVTICIHYQVTCDRRSVFEVNVARFGIYSGDFLESGLT